MRQRSRAGIISSSCCRRIDKFTVGESTNLIVQDEAYLAQARSTEVAARSDWMKAKLALDRSLGDLLEQNNIVFDDVVEEKVH
jgi:outer membrane protein